MYNYFMLVGTVVSDVELREVGEGKKVVNLLLSVRREFRTAEGTYNYDTIRISLWEIMAEIAADTLKKGSKIGIKGHIRVKMETLENNVQAQFVNLIADRIIYFDDNNKMFSNKGDSNNSMNDGFTELGE